MCTERPLQIMKKRMRMVIRARTPSIVKGNKSLNLVWFKRGLQLELGTCVLASTRDYL